MTRREPLRDGHGRLIGDLRLSVVDRCNFRCQYCMPAEGLPWLERDDILHRGDRAPVALLASMESPTRLTGEPLVRRDFPTLVGSCPGRR
jgi:cyclic pyranopterin phosphate synthase